MEIEYLIKWNRIYILKLYVFHILLNNWYKEKKNN